MGSNERAGVKDFGHVELVDVVPDVPPDVPSPAPAPDLPTPVQQAQRATIETTGADPPPGGE